MPTSSAIDSIEAGRQAAVKQDGPRASLKCLASTMHEEHLLCLVQFWGVATSARAGLHCGPFIFEQLGATRFTRTNDSSSSQEAEAALANLVAQ
ncbi:hypothetical protein AXG93_3822s1120 [Marchantia polymorpha subsp. ruderalis]|uniref:Uncharacterized protein n=1 Tax=Marchantia polymorpha subsp. ruderalis TaxID=1480154 RepID=A0A176WMJ3_MARPO|nr:hypothetical protein AXG93_3822s1120 [Marchantia polymorpha subsp. ruderalis]